MQFFNYLVSAWFFFAALPHGIVSAIKVVGIVAGIGVAALLTLHVGRKAGAAVRG